MFIHSDDKGLVLTPACADNQVVIIPIMSKGKEELINNKTDEIYASLKKAGIRAKVDDRQNYSLGFKINDGEILGIPIRIEIGAKEIENNQVKIARRFDGAKKFLPIENLSKSILDEFEDIKTSMFNSAQAKLDAKKKTADNWDDFMTHINNKCIVLTPWCGIAEEEEKVKAKSALESKGAEEEGGLSGKAKTLCIPFGVEKPKEGVKCFFTGKQAVHYIYWGRSY